MAKKKQEVKIERTCKGLDSSSLPMATSLFYLDYYTGDVIRKRKIMLAVNGNMNFLKLIPYTRKDKKRIRQRNEATLALAKAIQSKRIVELQNDAHGFQNTNKSKANVIDYLMNMRSQSKERGSLNYEKTVGNTIVN